MAEPVGWTVARLGDVAEVVDGRYLAKTDYVQTGGFEVHGAGGVMGTHDRALDPRPLVVAGRIGTIGKVRFCPEGAWVNNNALALTPTDPSLLPKMLFLLLEQFDWSSVTGRTAQPFVRKTELVRSFVAFPPLADQRRIVDLISAVSDALSAYATVGSASARARISVMADFFASLAGPERRLGDVATVAQGSSLPVALQGSQTGSVPWYKVKDMASLGNDWGYRRAETMVDASTIERHGGRTWPVGTVVFPRVGAAVATEKKRRIEVAGACDENHLLVVPGPDLDSGFLLAVLENLRLASLVRSDGYPSLNQRIVGDIPLVVPDRKTQQALAQTLEALRSVEEASAVAVAMATAVRGALLDALMSGASTLPTTYDRFVGGAA